MASEGTHAVTVHVCRENICTHQVIKIFKNSINMLIVLMSITCIPKCLEMTHFMPEKELLRTTAALWLSQHLVIQNMPLVEPSVPFCETEWLKFQIFGSHWLQVTLRLDGIPVFTVHDQTLGRKTFHIYRLFFFSTGFHVSSIHREAEREREKEREISTLYPQVLVSVSASIKKQGRQGRQGPQQQEPSPPLFFCFCGCRINKLTLSPQSSKPATSTSVFSFSPSEAHLPSLGPPWPLGCLPRLLHAEQERNFFQAALRGGSYLFPGDLVFLFCVWVCFLFLKPGS